jgi:hypothetical protein
VPDLNVAYDVAREVDALHASYCWAIDGGDGEALAACFAPDGVLQIGDREFRGAEQIRGLAQSIKPGAPRHHYDNLVITPVSDGVVRARSYFTLLGGDGAVAGLGTYDDDLAHDPVAGWRWTHKRVNFQWRA